MAVSPNRRAGLRVRRDLEGIDSGVDWTKSRSMCEKCGPFEEGVMLDILSGGVITKERVVRHGRVKNTNDKCPFPLCSGTEREDRSHRYLFCPQFEDLRTDAFKEYRARHAELHECEKQCGIVLNGSFWNDKAEEIQCVMLQIELKARDLTSEDLAKMVKNLSEGDTKKIYTTYTGSSAGAGGTRGKFGPQTGGVNNSPPAYKPPKSPHPNDMITNDEFRISCAKCLRNISRTNSANVIKEFWEAECIDMRDKITARSKGRLCSMSKSLKYKQGKGAASAKEWVRQQKAHHGGHGQLLWSGDVKALVTCTDAAWYGAVRLPTCGLLQIACTNFKSVQETRRTRRLPEGS